MKINKQKVEKFLAFTLAEVLITMIIITLMTLASIPVIKKSKEYREAAKDKNTWMAMYDQNDNLRVFVDGAEKPDLVVGSGSNQYAKFEPPKGVTRFNVTVVGGGGGGAAGEAGTGQSKVFGPGSTDNSFVPVNDGIYQIVAIGGGGGGGGGAVACDGGGGYSGGAIIAQARLLANEVYTVAAGSGGSGGQPQKPLSMFLDFLAPAMWIAAIAGTIVTGGAGIAVFGSVAAAMGAMGGSGVVLATVTQILKGNQPTDRKDGGGYGISSGFAGNGADGLIEIEACGGGGGQHVRKKAVWKCKATGGQEGCSTYWGTNRKTETKATGVISYVKQDPWKDGDRKKKPNGWICRDKEGGGIECRGEVGSQLPTILKDMVPSQFGSGGRGGNYRKTGKPGQGGFVQVQEIAVYGGGGGQSGAVSFYSYTKSPLEKGEEFVKVYPGKGGKGGVTNGEAGEDGMFSRFGNRIVADGGIGGEPRAKGIEEGNTNYEAKGEDGIPSAIPSNLQEKINYPSGITPIEETYGGLSHTKSCKYDGLGSGDSCEGGGMAIPGTGGGGGAAKGTNDFNWSNVKFGRGGNGASGIVMVTW